MNKNELVKVISDKVGYTQKDCGDVVNELFNVIVETLKKGDEVVITGFGKFVVKARPAKEGTNPKTGEKIKIPASKAPVFKAGKAFKDGVQ